MISVGVFQTEWGNWRARPKPILTYMGRVFPGQGESPPAFLDPGFLTAWTLAARVGRSGSAQCVWCPQGFGAFGSTHFDPRKRFGRAWLGFQAQIGTGFGIIGLGLRVEAGHVVRHTGGLVSSAFTSSVLGSLTSPVPNRCRQRERTEGPAEGLR